MKRSTMKLAILMVLVSAGAAAADVLFSVPWGSGPGQLGFYNQTKDGFNQPYSEGPGGLALGARGELWISDQWNDRLLCFGRDGKLVRELTMLGNEKVRRPKAIWVEGDSLVVLNGETSQLVKLDLASGNVQKIGRLSGQQGALRQPELFGVSMNTVCVQDDWRSELVCFGSDGQELSRKPFPLGGLAADAAGNIFTVLHKGGSGETSQWALVSTDRTGKRTERMNLPRPAGAAGLDTPAVVGLDKDGGAVVRWVKKGQTNRYVVVRYSAQGAASAPLGETNTSVSRQTFAVAPDGRVVSLNFDAGTAPRGGVQVLELK